MKRNKKAKYSARDLTKLTTRAVEQAAERRAKLLDEAELDQVVGGLAATVGRIDGGGVLTGAKGPDEPPIVFGQKTLGKVQ